MFWDLGSRFLCRVGDSGALVLRVRVPYLVPGHFSSCRGDGFLASQRKHFGMFLAYKNNLGCF